MKEFDFGVGWTIPGDKESLFLNTLEKECKDRNLNFILVDENNIEGFAEAVKGGKLKIKVYLDMASETYNPKDKFTRFAYNLKDSGSRIIDDPDDVKAAADKSITHFDLSKSALPTPYTVMVRNWEPARKLTADERKGLGAKFIIKPASGYGRKGVKIIEHKDIIEDLSQARKFHKGDNFLLQEIIEPLDLGGSPAWFRVFHLFGEIVPCWWNPQTRAYKQVTLKETDTYNLTPLMRLTSEIARITRIDWFSCEICIDKRNKNFLVIDYMNDQCAVDQQSKYKDGVPDDLIEHIASRVIEKSWNYIMGRFTLTYRAVWFPKIKVKDEDV